MKTFGSPRIHSWEDVTWSAFVKKGMTKAEFEQWKKDWFERAAQCQHFNCIHESMSCGIEVLCGHCSIYETYKKQENPIECRSVDCRDCVYDGGNKDILGFRKCKFPISKYEG